MTPEEANEKLAQYRVAIDEIDRRLVALLNQRTQVVEFIGQVKREARLPVYEPRREEQVFENIFSANQGPITHDAVKRIFERIIDEMRGIQRDRMLSENRSLDKKQES